MRSMVEGLLPAVRGPSTALRAVPSPSNAGEDLEPRAPAPHFQAKHRSRSILTQAAAPSGAAARDVIESRC